MENNNKDEKALGALRRELVAERLTSARKAAGISSAAEVARLCGMKENRVRGYFSGIRAPGFVEIEKFAAVLNVSPAFLSGYEEEASSEKADLSFIKSLLDSRTNSKFITVSDDSMSPDIKNGDNALIDLDLDMSSGSGLFAITVGEMTLIRKLAMTASGKISVSWTNDQHHDDLTLADPNELTILGRAVWIGRAL